MSEVSCQQLNISEALFDPADELRGPVGMEIQPALGRKTGTLSFSTNIPLFSITILSCMEVSSSTTSQIPGIRIARFPQYTVLAQGEIHPLKANPSSRPSMDRPLRARQALRFLASPHLPQGDGSHRYLQEIDPGLYRTRALADSSTEDALEEEWAESWATRKGVFQRWIKVHLKKWIIDDLNAELLKKAQLLKKQADQAKSPTKSPASQAVSTTPTAGPKSLSKNQEPGSDATNVSSSSQDNLENSQSAERTAPNNSEAASPASTEEPSTTYNSSGNSKFMGSFWPRARVEAALREEALKAASASSAPKASVAQTENEVSAHESQQLQPASAPIAGTEQGCETSDASDSAPAPTPSPEAVSTPGVAGGSNKTIAGDPTVTGSPKGPLYVNTSTYAAVNAGRESRETQETTTEGGRDSTEAPPFSLTKANLKRLDKTKSKNPPQAWYEWYKKYHKRQWEARLGNSHDEQIMLEVETPQK
ncbi:hypothetical protein F66182_7560 [Fusarium sp. NRRL 66182]|nr:hypothetical protein F66182_7560 [Fusarium sp. NRRL 66182]